MRYFFVYHMYLSGTETTNRERYEYSAGNSGGRQHVPEGVTMGISRNRNAVMDRLSFPGVREICGRPVS